MPTHGHGTRLERARAVADLYQAPELLQGPIKTVLLERRSTAVASGYAIALNPGHSVVAIARARGRAAHACGQALLARDVGRHDAVRQTALVQALDGYI